jgi:hypothetical protein
MLLRLHSLPTMTSSLLLMVLTRAARRLSSYVTYT